MGIFCDFVNLSLLYQCSGKASCYVVGMPMDMLHGVNLEVILQLHLNFQMTAALGNLGEPHETLNQNHLPKLLKTSDPQRL